MLLYWPGNHYSMCVANFDSAVLVVSSWVYSVAKSTFISKY